MSAKKRNAQTKSALSQQSSRENDEHVGGAEPLNTKVDLDFGFRPTSTTYEIEDRPDGTTLERIHARRSFNLGRLTEGKHNVRIIIDGFLEPHYFSYKGVGIPNSRMLGNVLEYIDGEWLPSGE